MGHAELLSLLNHNQDATKQCSRACQHLEKAYGFCSNFIPHLIFFSCSVGKSDYLLGLAYTNLSSYLMLQDMPESAMLLGEKGHDILCAQLGKHNNITHNSAANLANIYKRLEVCL